MPPHLFTFADSSRIPQTSTPTQDDYGLVFRSCVLVLVVVAVLRITITRYISRKKKSSTDSPIVVPEKRPVPGQRTLEKEPSKTATLETGHQQTPGFSPSYPWTAPPQPLPGPYDPRLYPLPTLRRYSYDPSAEGVEVKRTIENPYTRRISMNSIPVQENTLRGTVTVSSKGWRRNQWIISGE